MVQPTALRTIDIALKVALVALLAFGAFSGLQQFEGKAFGGRLIAYPIAVLVLPIAWLLWGRRRPFPYLADILITAPFLIDVVGNAADLYDTLDWWDGKGKVRIDYYGPQQGPILEGEFGLSLVDVAGERDLTGKLDLHRAEDAS